MATYNSTPHRTSESIEQERTVTLGPIHMGRQQYHYYQEDDPNVPYTLNRVATQSQIERNTLNQLYFSKENINRVQHQIKRSVYERSGGKYVIGPQDETELFIIMRSIYFSKGRNLNCDFANQIAELNNYVVNECTPKIISQVEQYYGYIRDASQLYMYNPIERPLNMSSAGTKELRSVTSIF